MTIQKIKLYYKSELENLDKVLKTLLENKESINSDNSILLSGFGVYLFNFYNGIENILKRVLEYKGIKIKEGPFWHKELLKECVNENIIDEKLRISLLDYLSFRHYFVHGYAFTLEIDRLQNLIKNISSVYQEFKKNIESSININS
jgi:hypothetical protein